MTLVFLCVFSDAPHGTIRFLTSAGEVEMVKFYWSPEPLQFGDQVQFRIATRSYDGLIYAVELVVEQTAKEIRFRVRRKGCRGCGYGLDPFSRQWSRTK